MVDTANLVTGELVAPVSEVSGAIEQIELPPIVRTAETRVTCPLCQKEIGCTQAAQHYGRFHKDAEHPMLFRCVFCEETITANQLRHHWLHDCVELVTVELVAQAAQTVVEALPLIPPAQPPAQPKRKRGRPPGKRWIGNVERELLTVTAQPAKGANEDYQTYQKRLIDAAERLENTDWHQLSEFTQQWTNDQIGALGDKPIGSVQIPPFPRVPLSKRITILEPVKLSPPASQRRGRKPKVKPPLLVESVSGAARQLREKALELRAIADTLMRKADLLEN